MRCDNTMSVLIHFSVFFLWFMFGYAACWLSITVVTTPTVIAEESHEQCYNLTGATHCFKVPPPGSGDLLQNFDDASKWCADQGYHGLVIDSSEVQSAVERFLEAFELTSDDVWTSARRSTEGEWKWVNGVVYINGKSLCSSTERRRRLDSPPSSADIDRHI